MKLSLRVELEDTAASTPRAAARPDITARPWRCPQEVFTVCDVLCCLPAGLGAFGQAWGKSVLVLLEADGSALL